LPQHLPIELSFLLLDRIELNDFRPSALHRNTVRARRQLKMPGSAATAERRLTSAMISREPAWCGGG
jgi:hypothetical protein